MNYQNEQQQVTGFLENFASALNAANAAIIPSFFSKDSKFMPDGTRTINDPAQLAKSAEKNLSMVDFRIRYTIEDIHVDGDFAFVTARANTSQSAPGNEHAVSKVSRDFFVLKKTSENWKIYRYIFNKVS